MGPYALVVHWWERGKEVGFSKGWTKHWANLAVPPRLAVRGNFETSSEAILDVP